MHTTKNEAAPEVSSVGALVGGRCEPTHHQKGKVHVHHNPTHCLMTESAAVQLKRRRSASYRCAEMACCRCRDPFGCRCHAAEVVTDRYVDGYRDAAEHLLDAGL